MRRQTGTLTGNCEHCGRTIQFSAESIDTEAMCPYCRKQTVLMLAPPPHESWIPTRMIVWSIIALLILLAGAIGISMAFKRAKRLADDLRPPPAAVEQKP